MQQKKQVFLKLGSKAPCRGELTALSEYRNYDLSNNNCLNNYNNNYIRQYNIIKDICDGHYRYCSRYFFSYDDIHWQ